MSGRRLARSFYERDTLLVARELIGCVLRHDTPEGRASGRIVETEAYTGEGDMASHARFGRTPRSSVLFGIPGTAYVYFVYGMHYLFNAVTEMEDVAGAVLVRALEPLEGLELMVKRRGCGEARLLASGPARLTQALGITLEQNRADLVGGPLGIWDGGSQVLEIDSTPRIGVAGSKERPWRFTARGNEFVST